MFDSTARFPDWCRVVPLLWTALVIGCGTGSRTGDPTGNATPKATTVEDQQPLELSKEPDWFRDAPRNGGIEFRAGTGREAGRFAILETLGSGVGMDDLDGDGDLDLVFAGGGEIARETGVVSGLAPGLFLNDGSGQFANASGQLTASTWQYSHGVVLGDYDLDGRQDLVLAAFGGSQLLRNGGDRPWTDETEAAGMSSQAWETTGVFADVNGDGWPDLYLATYVAFDPTAKQECWNPGRTQRDVCPPQEYRGVRDTLWLNLGDGTFVDVSESAGLPDNGKGLGVLAADFNDDRIVDLYVANDGEPNHLLLGGDGFPLVERAVASGVAVGETGAAEGSMGVAWGDVNGDGRGDLFVTNFELEDNSLYEGLGDGLYDHTTARRGLGGAARLSVAFGTTLSDFNVDGWPDLVVLNGHVVYHSNQSPFHQTSLLYRNHNGKRFADVSTLGGPVFSKTGAGRGCACGDVDSDGALDLVVTDLERGATVLMGTQRTKSWIDCELTARSGDREAVGGRIESMFSGRTVTTFPSRGDGWASHSPARRRILADETEEDGPSVTVEWPSGRRELFGPLAPRRTHRLMEGGGRAAVSR